jgi:hypothetical protein
MNDKLFFENFVRNFHSNVSLFSFFYWLKLPMLFLFPALRINTTKYNKNDTEKKRKTENKNNRFGPLNRFSRSRNKNVTKIEVAIILCFYYYYFSSSFLLLFPFAFVMIIKLFDKIKKATIN